MQIIDSRGNELIEIIDIDENAAAQKHAPVTHCLAIVTVGGDYLLGWNNWRKDWEIFGGCMEAGETMRQCILRECREELGISDMEPEYLGLMHLKLVPDYFSTECREEYGGLYGIRLPAKALQEIRENRPDRDEIGKVALLQDIGAHERIAEIDRGLLECMEGRQMKNLQDSFCWYEQEGNAGAKSSEERYQRIVDWAGQARGTNPDAFDAVTAWLLEADKWSEEELAGNRRIFMEGIIGRFSEQCRRLRAELNDLVPSGLVNMAVFDTLDRFEDELTGATWAEELKEAAGKVFADFSAIKDRKTRELFAGGITGHEGTDTVEIFGYVNFLKDCDAGVQWALFMPDVVKRQQKGFRMARFEYRKLPAMRFIGIEKDATQDAPGQQEIEKLQRTLDAMEGYRSGFDCDALLMHHFGRGVDVERCHLLWGRFMAADAPVPEGYICVDFVPDHDGASGMPYLSQFAYAEFTGDPDAMHGQEGFDCDAMYDVTRNTILAQNVMIPYPEKYWTAEVFPQGFQKGSSVYLFSVDR